jgi:hypothetical protein
MIEVKLRFWTNGLAPEAGKIAPKRAWATGVVRVEKNKSHGIEPGKPLPFHSLLDVGAVIEKVLIEHGIVLHSSRRMHFLRELQFATMAGESDASIAGFSAFTNRQSADYSPARSRQRGKSHYDNKKTTRDYQPVPMGTVPAHVPPDCVLCHDHIAHNQRTQSGRRGFRGWFATKPSNCARAAGPVCRITPTAAEAGCGSRSSHHLIFEGG